MATRRDFGTILSRGHSRNFFVRFYIGHGTEQRRFERAAGPTKELAKDVLRRVQHMIVRGKGAEQILHEVFGDPLPGRITFRDAVPQYLEYAEANLKASTVYGYQKLLAKICREEWTTRLLEDVERSDIVRWTDTRSKETISPQTVNNGLAVTSALFRWAIERGFANKNPVQGVRRLRTPKGRETYLSATEARALVEVAPDRMRVFLSVALHTGMRRGEILSLSWRAVDLEQGVLTVEESKNRRPRTIRMNATLGAELARHALAGGKRGRNPDRQVVSTPDGADYTTSMLRLDIMTAVERCAEIPAHKKPNVTTHVLRHTAASLMVAAGVPIFDVAKVLGHETIQVTMRYAHFAPEAGRAAVYALDKMLGLKSDAERVQDWVVGFAGGIL